jgi:PTS hybrid protein
MAEILIISHSKQIAEGTKALVEQMAGGVVIHAGGGVNDGEDIGTNIDLINDMLSQIKEDTICFYDIGSSKMNLEMAVEMYDGDHHLYVSDAPIVEGSFLAAVELSIGTNLETILEKLGKKVK